jgi:inositol-phosphate transport system substrate-binding protein
VNTRLLIGGVAVVIIIVALAAYFAMRPATEVTPTTPTHTETVTETHTETAPATTPAKPEKPELTGNVEEDIVNIANYLLAQGIDKATFTVWGVGDPNSVLRTYGIVEAAYRLNKILEEKGINFKIVIDMERSQFKRGGGDQMAEDFAAAFQAQNNPDIMANSFKHIARFAEEGYLLDITEYLQAYSSFAADFYPSLMEAVKYKGRYYGIPQDTEARPLYWRTDVAKCVMEKTGTDILADLYSKVETGQVTWREVYEYAKAAKDAGCAEWGVLHRKGSAHPDLIQFIFAFGGELEDKSTGKLVLPLDAVYKWLYVEWKMARDGLIPEDMMAWDWGKQIHPAVVSGKTLAWIGGTWHWTEWQTKPYYTDPSTGQARALTAEEVKKLFYYTLFPAGEPGMKPVTLSQPFVWMISSNAGKDNPKYDELKDVYHMLAFLLVVKASDPDINAIHSIISAHLPVREEAAKLLEDRAWLQKLANLELDLSSETKQAISDIVKATVNDINVEFLASASKLLEYTRLTPMHPLYPKLADILRDAVDKVLRGEMDPAAATNYIIDKVKADPDLANAVEIRGEIPQGWEYP